MPFTEFRSQRWKCNKQPQGHWNPKTWNSKKKKKEFFYIFYFCLCIKTENYSCVWSSSSTLYHWFTSAGGFPLLLFNNRETFEDYLFLFSVIWAGRPMRTKRQEELGQESRNLASRRNLSLRNIRSRQLRSRVPLIWNDTCNSSTEKKEQGKPVASTYSHDFQDTAWCLKVPSRTARKSQSVCVSWREK